MSRDVAPMRVALVLPSYAGGGAERVMLTLAAHLDRATFLPSLIVLDARGPLAALVPRDVEVVTLARPRLRQALPALARAIRRLEPHAVLTTIGYMNLGVLLVRPFLGPVAIAVRESNPPLGPLPSWLLRAAYRLLYRRASLVVAPSERLARQLVEDFRVPAALVTVLYNPVDVERLRRGAAPPKRFAGSGPRFVAAGRLTAQKGFDRLLRLIAAAPHDAHVTIMGDGPDRAPLEALAGSLGVADKVRFAGFEPNPASWLAGADALLLPSRWEGLPNVALEALACGTAVIAAREAGGIDEIARLAPQGAVRIADSDAEFLAAMAISVPNAGCALRESQLPHVFHLGPAIAAYAAAIGRMATRRSRGLAPRAGERPLS